MVCSATANNEQNTDSFLSAVLNALPSDVAILNEEGIIQAANGNWSESDDRGPSLRNAAIGTNYLELCDLAGAAGDVIAAATANGIREVLQAKRPTFSIEYSGQDSKQSRHFAARVTHFLAGERLWAVITREDIGQQKAAEGALRESEARFRSLIENAADVITILDEEGQIRYESPSAKRVLGNGGGTRSGRSFFDFIHADDLAGVVSNFTRTLDNPGKKVHLEFRWRGRGEQWKVMEGTANNLLSEPSVAGVVINYREVTERKRAEEAQVRLTAVMDWTPSFVTIADPHGRLLYLNRATRKLLGIANNASPSQINLTDLHPQRISDLLLREGIPAAVRDGVWTGETAMLNAEGKEVPVLQVLLAHEAPGGGVDYFSTVAHDITERKATEAALRESDEIFSQIAENINETLWIFDLDQGRPVYVSPSYELIWGKPIESVMENPAEFLSCVAPADRNRVNHVSLPGNSGGADEEFQITRPDGVVRWLRGRSFPIRDARGSVCRIVGLTEDVTGRKQLESELRQAQRLEAIGHLAAGVAHEINTPIQYVGDNIRFLQDSFDELSGVLARSAELAALGDSGDLIKRLGQFQEEAIAADFDYVLGEIPQAVQQSLEGVERVAEIVRAMKDFSHPGTAEKVPLDVNKAIQSTLTVARNEWKYVAKLITDLQPDLSMLLCFPGEFNQAILNVIVNAAHAIADAIVPDGNVLGTLTVISRQVEDTIEIMIKDTGAGIPEDVRPRIYDPFFTTKGVSRGTGQGLTLVHSIVVDKHGGSVSFESDIGRGTTFILRFPLNVSTETANVASAA